MKKLKFLMGLHCHQPVDNFGHIFEEAYNKSYEPFLTVLEKHPRIKLSLHYSGPILDWVLKNKPGFIRRIKTLADKGQIELLTGGYYEPVLQMIPPRDQKAQIEKLTRAIKELFGYEARGAWLTERVWDPSVPGIYENLGIRYTIVDDYHLKCAGLKEDEIYSLYSIKGAGDFYVFASVKKLRYAMPFREPEITIDFLRGLKENPLVNCVTFADDCEKFGFWPYTYNWVYKKRWLDRFFAELEEQGWIETMTFTEAIQSCAPRQDVEIPHSSYEEMSTWCGGNFNNFFKKYPESDLMRRRMLSVSARLKEKKESGQGGGVSEAKKELYKAQSNCPYWHGIFGGIYMNFLRQGIYGHIIKAEKLMGKPGNGIKGAICVTNGTMALFIDTDNTGSFFEIDYIPLDYNLVNTIARRYEPYHEKLEKRKKLNIKNIKKKADEDTGVDLYEVLGIKERNLRKFLAYDPYPRFSGLCHIMKPGTTFADFMRSKHATCGTNNLAGPYAHKTEEKDGKFVIELGKESPVSIDNRLYSFRLNKCVILERDSCIFIKFILENTSREEAVFLFGIEFNWSLEDNRFLRGRRMKKIKELEILDKYNGIRINHVFEAPVGLWSFPVYTINESEKGLGKNFQEISLLFHRKLALKAKEKFSLGMFLKVSK